MFVPDPADMTDPAPSGTSTTPDWDWIVATDDSVQPAIGDYIFSDLTYRRNGWVSRATTITLGRVTMPAYEVHASATGDTIIVPENEISHVDKSDSWYAGLPF